MGECYNKSSTTNRWLLPVGNCLESFFDLYIPAASVQRLRFFNSYDQTRYPKGLKVLLLFLLLFESPLAEGKFYRAVVVVPDVSSDADW